MIAINVAFSTLFQARGTPFLCFSILGRSFDSLRGQKKKQIQYHIFEIALKRFKLIRVRWVTDPRRLSNPYFTQRLSSLAMKANAILNNGNFTGVKCLNGVIIGNQTLHKDLILIYPWLIPAFRLSCVNSVNLKMNSAFHCHLKPLLPLWPSAQRH